MRVRKKYRCQIMQGRHAAYRTRQKGTPELVRKVQQIEFQFSCESRVRQVECPLQRVPPSERQPDAMSPGMAINVECTLSEPDQKILITVIIFEEVSNQLVYVNPDAAIRNPGRAPDSALDQSVGEDSNSAAVNVAARHEFG